MKTTYDDHTAIRSAIMVFNIVVFCMVILNAILNAAGVFAIWPWAGNWFLTLVVDLIPLLWGVPFMMTANLIYQGKENPSLVFGVLQLIFWGIVPGVLDLILTNTLADEGINPLNEDPEPIPENIAQ